MKTIWKFRLGAMGYERISMPAGAQLLTVQMQGSEPQLWAVVDTSTPAVEQRTIAIFGTGHPLPVGLGQYLGTIQLHGGSLIFHAFEVTP